MNTAWKTFGKTVRIREWCVNNKNHMTRVLVSAGIWVGQKTFQLLTKNKFYSVTLRSKFINMLIQKSDEHKERIMTELSSNKESIKVNSHILRKCGTSRQTDNQYAGIIVELNANKYQIHFMRNLKGMVACLYFHRNSGHSCNWWHWFYLRKQ